MKFRKVSKTNICQSCGSPWSAGKFTLQIKKTAKAKIIKKILKISKSQKLGLFKQHISQRFSESPSAISIKCGYCLKSTTFPAPLPPQEARKKPSVPILDQKQKEVPAKLRGLQQKDQKVKQKHKHEKLPAIPAKNHGRITKAPIKKQISKSQLKNISKSLKQNNSKPTSSLQSFLSSVK